jgi:hypothetical protein
MDRYEIWQEEANDLFVVVDKLKRTERQDRIFNLQFSTLEFDDVIASASIVLFRHISHQGLLWILCTFRLVVD